MRKFQYFYIYVEAVIYLLLYILHDCTFKDVNYSCKRLILDVWLGPESAFAD